MRAICRPALQDPVTKRDFPRSRFDDGVTFRPGMGQSCSMASQLTAEPPCAGTSLANDLDVPPNPVTRSAAVDAAWRRQRDIFFVSEARKTSRTMLGLGVFVQLF